MPSSRMPFDLGFTCGLSRALAGAFALFFGSGGFGGFVAPAGALSTVQDQSDVDLSTSFAISTGLAADDLHFPVTSRLDTVTVWLSDVVSNDNGQLDGFSGSLSWAIYSDNAGPDTLLYSGIDTTPELVDTGLQTDVFRDLIRVRIDLDGQPLIPAGIAWLAIHEGPWGSAFDGSAIGWTAAVSTAGSPAFITTNEANPTPAEWTASARDLALVAECDPYDWMEATLYPQGAGDISDAVSATDFTLLGTRRIDSLDAWIGELAANNGVLDTFGGTLSWAIYSDAAGTPGTLVASGHDSSPSLVDSGQNIGGGGDIFRVRIELSPAPTLTFGVWWLALHEGVWASPDDDSTVYWIAYPTAFGNSSRQAADESNPGSWSVLFPDRDLAFVLFDDALFGSGFDAGVTCAWSAVIGGATCP